MFPRWVYLKLGRWPLWLHLILKVKLRIKWCKYFRRNHRDCKPGIFSISLTTGEVLHEVVAEEDFLCRTSAKELNEMRDAINEMRKENGEPPLTEEELPTATEDEEWYQYADHAIRRVREELKKALFLKKERLPGIRSDMNDFKVDKNIIYGQWTFYEHDVGNGRNRRKRMCDPGYPELATLFATVENKA